MGGHLTDREGGACARSLLARLLTVRRLGKVRLAIFVRLGERKLPKETHKKRGRNGSNHHPEVLLDSGVLYII